SQNALDQPAGTTAGQLQLNVVVEFQCEDIDVGQVARQRRLPRTQVGNVPDGPIRSRGIWFGFNSKSESRAAIVLEFESPAADSRDGFESPPWSVRLDQSGKLQALKLGALPVQRSQMLRMAKERHPQFSQSGQRAGAPVVAVCVREDDSPDALPGRADFL